MVRGWLILAGVICAAVVASSCRISINGGYNFDYKGAKSERNEIGDIDSSIREIVVNNRFGKIVVTRQAEKPGWEWTGACWATKSEDADKFLGELKLDVSQTGETQTWTVEIPDSDRSLRGVRSNLTIRVPASVNVVTENRHGDTQIERTSGSVNVSSHHGNVQLDELVGSVKVSNRHGKVVANGLAAASEFNIQHGPANISGTHGPLIVNSRHGNVKLENVGAQVTAEMHHGDLTATQVRANVGFESHHGSVSLNMIGDQFTSIMGDGGHSNIKITLPKDCTPNADVDLSHGRLRSTVSTDSKSKVLIKIDASHTNVTLGKSE